MAMRCSVMGGRSALPPLQLAARCRRSTLSHMVSGGSPIEALDGVATLRLAVANSSTPQQRRYHCAVVRRCRDATGFACNTAASAAHRRDRLAALLATTTTTVASRRSVGAISSMSSFDKAISPEAHELLESYKGDHYLNAKKIDMENKAKEAAKYPTPQARLRKHMVESGKFDVELVVRAGLDPEAEYAEYLHERKKLFRSAYWWLFRVIAFSTLWFAMFFFPAYYFN